MKRTLIIDVETSGLDLKTDHIVEIAAVVWSVEHRCIESAVSSVVRAESNEAEHINKIPTKLIQNTRTKLHVLTVIKEMARGIDAVLAHNAQFDRLFLAEDVEFETPWVCTMADLKWPYDFSSHSLVNMALEVGIPVYRPHRALTDCILIAHMLEALDDPAATLCDGLRRSELPKFRFKAEVGYADRDLAKAAGFGWKDDGVGGKIWQRVAREEDIKALKIGFPIKRLHQVKDL